MTPPKSIWIKSKYHSSHPFFDPSIPPLLRIAVLGCGVQTMRNWRHIGKGPAYVKVGRLVRYYMSDLESFMASRRIDPERRGQ
ncbi:MAG: helix-turn-helix transcriptional regulator [Syntrophobacteraceae bacterium]